MKKQIRMLPLLAMTLAVLLTLQLSPAAFAKSENPLPGIFASLVADSSDYMQTKNSYLDFFPDIQWNEALSADSIVITVSGSEYLDGSWSFTQEETDLTATFEDGDYIGAMMTTYLVKAVGDNLGMDSDVMMGYVNGLDVLNIENTDYASSTDAATGTVTFRIQDTTPWDMAELDSMILDDNTLFFSPLDQDYISSSANIGKVMLVSNGSVDGVTLLLGEYGALDDLALQSLRNAVSVLQPRGAALFLAEYTELTDVDTADYAVILDVTQDEVATIIDDPKPSYQYAIIRFGAPDA